MTTRGKRIRILHCITSLDADGAQVMLRKLCECLPSSYFEISIINLSGPTDFAEGFKKLGIPVLHLGMRRGVPSLGALRRLRKHIEEFRPQLIQGWMYHGNIMALAGRALATDKPVVLWNIRKSVTDIREYRFPTRLVVWLGGVLSSRVEKVIYCGNSIAAQHRLFGYTASNQVVIANGFDTERFQPQADAYRAVRRELSLTDDVLLVGMTARYHPHKDHRNFLAGAAFVTAAMPNVHFVLAGRGVDEHNKELSDHLLKLNLTNRVHLLGVRSDIEHLLPAFDVYCLSSSAEGFPNSLGEAMACAVPCVSTAVGAAKELLGDTGIVVPPGDASQLGAAMLSLLRVTATERRTRGSKARERIIQLFSIASIAHEYEGLYRQVSAYSESGDFPKEHYARGGM